jgi:hypothetical protein
MNYIQALLAGCNTKDPREYLQKYNKLNKLSKMQKLNNMHQYNEKQYPDGESYRPRKKQDLFSEERIQHTKNRESEGKKREGVTPQWVQVRREKRKSKKIGKKTKERKRAAQREEYIKDNQN